MVTSTYSRVGLRTTAAPGSSAEAPKARGGRRGADQVSRSLWFHDHRRIKHQEAPAVTSDSKIALERSKLKMLLGLLVELCTAISYLKQWSPKRGLLFWSSIIKFLDRGCFFMPSDTQSDHTTPSKSCQQWWFSCRSWLIVGRKLIGDRQWETTHKGYSFLSHISLLPMLLTPWGKHGYWGCLRFKSLWFSPPWINWQWLSWYLRWAVLFVDIWYIDILWYHMEWIAYSSYHPGSTAILRKADGSQGLMKLPAWSWIRGYGSPKKLTGVMMIPGLTTSITHF